MIRHSDNTWERGRMLRLGLQFFAEDMGDSGGTGDDSASGEAVLSPEGEAGDTAPTKDGSAQGYYDAMTREERVDFLKRNGLMHHTAASARYKSATDKAARLDGLQSGFAELARVYGLDEGDHAAILRAALDRSPGVGDSGHGSDTGDREGVLEAALDRPVPVENKTEEREADGERGQSLLTPEDEAARLTREETARIREAALMRMTRQEEETRTAYPRFDFGEASRNPAFKAMVDAGLPMKTAYESAFHAELSAAAIAAAREQARAEAMAEYRANGARPEEGAGGSTGEAILAVSYRSMTREQLRAAEKKYL